MTKIFLQARVKNNMAAKLAERRQRRARVNLEQRESAALTMDIVEDHEDTNHDDHEHDQEHHEKKHKDKKHKDKKHKDKKHKKHKDKSDD